MEKGELKVMDLPIGELTPYINNPRYNDQAVLGVAASIKAYGFQQPIVVDRNMVIVAGHTRYKAAKLLGLETVPVAFGDDLTPEEARAYRLADNRTAEFATWDTELLEESLKELTEKGYEFPYDYNLEGVNIDEDMRLEFMGRDIVVDDNPGGNTGKENAGAGKTGAGEKEIICPRCGYNLSERGGSDEDSI